jgi:hypothetical protein
MIASVADLNTGEATTREVPMSKEKSKPRPNADLLQAVRHHKDQILKIRDVTEDQRPLLLFDFQRRKVHAYPYEQYKSMMREESQARLDQEYIKAIAKKKVLVVVWDRATRRLVTTTFRRG